MRLLTSPFDVPDVTAADAKTINSQTLNFVTTLFLAKHHQEPVAGCTKGNPQLVEGLRQGSQGETLGARCEILKLKFCSGGQEGPARPPFGDIPRFTIIQNVNIGMITDTNVIFPT